jgi:hypothetical protein
VSSRQETIHPLAPDHLPGFIPAADGSDPLFTFVVIFLIVLFLAVGIFYLKLHSLPERLGHKQNNTQLQLIAVLAVLALFTHCWRFLPCLLTTMCSGCWHCCWRWFDYRISQAL